MSTWARVSSSLLFLAAGAVVWPSAPAAPPAAAAPACEAASDKWSLWSSRATLRGANLYQRRVYPDLDADSMGPGPLGPPVTQEDFDRLSAMGANYVNLSHPGLFTEKPPYALDPAVRQNLDALIAMAQNANLYVVISFRTGPGRSEFAFFHGQDWFPPSYYNDQVWKEQAAQDAWAAMWRAAAEHYQGNPVVAGYDLMVEPNANDVWLDLWDAAEFYADYAGTLYDWNPLHARISAAIREVDADTPILTGGMSYSSLLWLPYVIPTGDAKTVYTFHMYEPHVYTHQDPPLALSYPGTFDADWDGKPDAVDRDWLDQFLATADAFAAQHGAAVACNEFGVKRWEPGADAYFADVASLLEQRGLNRALWAWAPDYPPRATDDPARHPPGHPPAHPTPPPHTARARRPDPSPPTHGPDPGNHVPVDTSDLIEAVRADWALNVDRPGCGLSCTAAAPAAAQQGEAVSFAATAAPSGGCTGAVAYDWDFGDGSAHGAEQNPSHTYTEAGSFTWTMTASAGTTACTKTGAITIHGASPPPSVDDVWKAGSPFKLKVAGTNFDPAVQVFIGSDAAPWPNVAFKGETYLVIKGGGALKARFPLGVPVPIRFVNPDGQSATFSYTR